MTEFSHKDYHETYDAHMKNLKDWSKHESSLQGEGICDVQRELLTAVKYVDVTVTVPLLTDCGCRTRAGATIRTVTLPAPSSCMTSSHFDTAAREARARKEAAAAAVAASR